MTHLSNAINRLMLERDLIASDVARKAGIDKSYLSLLRSGKHGGMSGILLKRLAGVLARNPKEEAELIAAHMKDESFGYYPKHVQVEVKGKPSKAASDLDPDVEYLQKHLSDSRLRNAVKSLAALHKSGNQNGNTKQPTQVPVKPRNICKL